MAKPKADSSNRLFRVLAGQVGWTIAAAMRGWLPGSSWGEIRRLLKSRRITVNGNLCTDAGYRLRLTDVVKLLSHSIAPPAGEKDVRIRYLDKHVVVVEKPAGITSTRHPDERELGAGRRQRQPTLTELLPRLIAKREGGRGGKGVKGGRGMKRGMPRVRPVHRLDRQTSGLMVFARTLQAEKHLSQQFRAHSIRRRYLAIVHGMIQPQTISSRLTRDRGDGRRGSTNLPNIGKPAVTHVRPIERLGDYTLVECRLETGRTHQIRIHLAERGHPVCGETVYNKPLFRPGRSDASGAPRLALCAVELGFTHPITGKAMRFEMPLSRDLAEFLARLRKANNR